MQLYPVLNDLMQSMNKVRPLSPFILTFVSKCLVKSEMDCFCPAERSI